MRRSGLIAICGLRTPLPRRTPATSSWRSRPSWRASQARWRAVLQKATASLAGPDSPTHEPAHGLDEVTALNPCPATAPTTLVDAISPSPTVRARPPRGTRRAMPIAAIDKAALTFPEPRRLRDREHVRCVARQPCLVCGRIPSDPHPLRFTQSRALGRKVSDGVHRPALPRPSSRSAPMRHRVSLVAQGWD